MDMDRIIKSWIGIARFLQVRFTTYKVLMIQRTEYRESDKLRVSER